MKTLLTSVCINQRGAGHHLQTSVYYDVVGAKTDIWDYDQIAQASRNGINGDYDGDYRPRNSLKYKKSIDRLDLYASYLFEDSEYLPGNDLRYKRHGGGSVGIDYHLTKDLTWGNAWNYTHAEMRDPGNGDSKTYDQNIVATGLNWAPENWTFSFTGGWYQNFSPTHKAVVNNYFTDDAWGIEYFAGYKFPIDKYKLKNIQTYFMGDRLEFFNGRNYQRIDNGVGIVLQLDYGFRVYYEHIFTSSTDNLGDIDLVSLRYDF